MNLSSITPRFLKRTQLATRFMEKTRNEKKVINGPFKGMKYEGNSICSTSDPKFLGTYEIELATALLNWKGIHFKTIIDVGAAEGYYAVGLSLLFPLSHVVAFESTELGKTNIRQLAQHNKVSDRIEIQGHCDLKQLKYAISNISPVLILMDIEGGERDILVPKEIQALINSHIIVELHDCFDPGVGELIKNRLSTSHYIEEIWSRERQYSDFTQPKNNLLRSFILPYLKKYASESRPERMRWFICTPKINKTH